MDEGGFYYKKAFYLTELGHYFAAIKALKIAEKSLNTTYISGLLGWCYANVEDFERSLYYYNAVYLTDKSESVLLGLAVSESQVGSVERAEKYIEQLKPFRSDPVLDGYVRQAENVCLSRSSS